MISSPKLPVPKLISQTVYLLVRCPRILTLLVIGLVFHSSVSAQETGSRLDFMNISPSAFQLGIGGNQSATPSGASSIYSNPALLTFNDRSVLDVNYSFWIQEFRNQFAALSLKEGRHTIGFAIYSSTADSYQLPANNPFPDASYVRYLSVAGAYAHKLGPFSIGVTGQFLHEEIDESQATGFAFTAGLAGEFFDERLRFGMAAANIGNIKNQGYETKEEVPSQFRTGVDIQAVRFTSTGRDEMTVLVSTHVNLVYPIAGGQSTDFSGIATDNPWLDLGLTVNFDNLILLKTGYRTGETERKLTYGLGFISDPVLVHYAIIPFSTGYGTAHSIGLQYRF